MDQKERIRQKLIGDVRSHIVFCNLLIKWEACGKLPSWAVSAILKARFRHVEIILAELAEKGGL